MDELLQAFLAELKDEARSAFTLATYRQNLRTFFAWCATAGVKAPEVSPEQLKGYLRRFDNPRTRRLHLAGLRSFYRYLDKRAVIATNPTRATDRMGELLLPLPRIERRAPRIITDDEEAALFRIARADLELRVLLRLMRFSRLRVGEVVGYRRRMYDPYTKQPVRFDAPGLRVRSVDLERKLIDVYGKGQREDIAEMDGKTAGLIRRLITTLTHQEPDAPLFQLPDGRPKGTKWAFARFRALCRTAGIQRHLTLHMLGHTFLTRFLEHGGNLKAAQRLARHRNLDSTLIYADYVRDGALRREFDQHNVDTDPDR